MKIQIYILVFCLVSLAGCSSIPVDYPRQASTAFNKPETTTIYKLFKPELAAHPGKSGCLLLTRGEDAFVSRKAMIDIAEHSLDMQYYTWKPDLTGKILVYALLQAADRGVRVRLLLDDLGSSGIGDIGMALIAAHPNVEIRLFNPFANRGLRGLELIFNLERLNHRMHNKALVIDNAMAILGGRNIADNYFDVNVEANFRDLDVASVGPVVQEISASFDRFWNNEWAIPIDALHERPSQEEFLAARKRLEKWYNNLHDFPYAIDKTAQQRRARLVKLKPHLVWARAEVLGDLPDKANSKQESEIIQVIRQLSSELDNELLVENAYFIPRDRGVESLRGLINKGVKVRVLTNSLASNDVIAAHAGYISYREDLLRAGVQLYELRPDAGIRNDRQSKTRSASSALHTKSIVFDREDVIIGTMNLDPRSIDINTEIVLHIDNETIARQVAEYLDTGVLPENSYKLKLRESKQADEAGNKDRIVWLTENNGKTIEYKSDPETGVMQNIKMWFMNLLPIEKHL